MIYYEDNAKQLHEIYVAPGRWDHANQLIEAEQWEELRSQFPPWSDQPPLGPRECNQMSYTDGRTGAQRTIYMPKGTMKRATELFVKEDWASLENEFEVWSKYRLLPY